MLGIPPETIPPLVMRAIVVDSLFLFSLIAFRRRKAIAAWWRGRQSPEEVRRDSAEGQSPYLPHWVMSQGTV